MDLTYALAQLHKERDAIDAAISALERRGQGGSQRAGRALTLVTAKDTTNGANHGCSPPDLPADEG
jgi:hypothetical protein